MHRIGPPPIRSEANFPNSNPNPNPKDDAQSDPNHNPKNVPKSDPNPNPTNIRESNPKSENPTYAVDTYSALDVNF